MRPWLAVLVMVRTVIAALAGLDGDDFSRPTLARTEAHHEKPAV